MIGVIAGVLALGALGGGFGYLFVKKKSMDDDARAAAAAQGAALAVVKGSLALESEPPGASIWINGDLRAEVTPASIAQLPTGVPLDVKLTMDGFEHAREQVTLKADDFVQPASQTRIRLELKRGSVVVEVKVAPESATPTFTLDGKVVAGGAKIDGVTSGVSHKLVVNAPGFAEQTVSFTGIAMETKRLEVTLEKAPEPKHATSTTTRSGQGGTTPAQPAGSGKLNVGASGGWCNVTVDGAPRGATPVAGVELSAGSHRVTCTTAEGKTQTATVTVPVDGTARYKFSL